MAQTPHQTTAGDTSPRKKRRLSEIDTNLLHTLVPGTLSKPPSTVENNLACY